MVGERRDIDVGDFAWDFGPDGNVAHLAKHDVTMGDIYEVLRSEPLFYLNVGPHAARYAMVGRDGRGRSLIIYLLATAESSVWKPVTGWQSQLAHRLLEEEGETDDER